jgi:hypothetical protein
VIIIFWYVLQRNDYLYVYKTSFLMHLTVRPQPLTLQHDSYCRVTTYIRWLNIRVFVLTTYVLTRFNIPARWIVTYRELCGSPPPVRKSAFEVVLCIFSHCCRNSKTCVMFRPELTGEASGSPPGCAKETHLHYFKIWLSSLKHATCVCYTEL